jgi:hypothetical protein
LCQFEKAARSRDPAESCRGHLACEEKIHGYRKRFSSRPFCFLLVYGFSGRNAGGGQIFVNAEQIIYKKASETDFDTLIIEFPEKHVEETRKWLEQNTWLSSKKAWRPGTLGGGKT